MVLTNAERQKRFRARLKAAARGADIGEQARDAIDAGIAAVWAFYERNPHAAGPQEYHADLAAFRIAIASDKRDGPARDARRWVGDVTDWNDDDRAVPPTEDEQAALERAIAVLDAALLAHVEIPPAPKGGRKRAAKAAE